MTICRTNIEMPTGAALDAVRSFLFGVVDGGNSDDKKTWRRLWNRIIKMEPGEMALIESKCQRSGPFHRRHMKIENELFDSQDRFDNFKMFRDWLKIGAAWVVW